MGLDPSLELDDIPLSIDATLNELLRSLDATLIPLSRFDATLIPLSRFDARLIPLPRFDATLIPLMRFDSGSLFGIGGGGGFFLDFGLSIIIFLIGIGDSGGCFFFGFGLLISGGGFFFKFGLLIFISCINSSIILIKICTYVLIKYFGLYTF